jgi:hypothetical protein
MVPELLLRVAELAENNTSAVGLTVAARLLMN